MKIRLVFIGLFLGGAGLLCFTPQVRSVVKSAISSARGPMHLMAPPIVWPYQSSTIRSSQIQNTILARIAPPKDTKRIPVSERSFGAWLRGLQLLPKNSQVLLYNGEPKSAQDVHEAVIDLDTGQRDLQQCADAIMRLRAEYLLALGKPIAFHPDVGKARVLRFVQGDRAAFSRYLTQVFTEAGSASLQAELSLVKDTFLQPGDVLIQGGFPGHAVLVVDVAKDDQGKQYVLLGQSYMPAQQFHLLKNWEDTKLSPWFDASLLKQSQGLKTPEWRAFYQKDVRRFPEN